MRSVVHVLSSLQLGGAERFVIDLSAIQRREGLDAQILTLGSGDDLLIGEARAQGIPLTVLGSMSGRLGRYKTAYRLIKKAEVVHIHSPYALRFLSAIIFLLRGKRVIYTRHGLNLLEASRWRRLHRFMRPVIDKVTFVTATGMEAFKKNHRWDDKDLCVIENGVHVPDNTNRTVMSPIKLGSVGRLVELKGQGFLLDAITMIERSRTNESSPSDYELHFYGTGPSQNALEAQALETGAPERIHFHGAVTDRDKIYANMDVLIVSSRTEGLSLVIMEAMARGICVIATNVGGNPTLVRPGENGHLVEYNDAVALAEAIKQLVIMPEKIRLFGANARKLIEENYSLYGTHTSYLPIYYPQ